VAEPLDTVHALMPKTATRAKIGSANAKNRRSAVAAGPRARRRSSALAAREAGSSDRDASNEPRGPSGTGAILPGENPDERAPTPPAEEDDVVFDSGDEAYQTDTQVAVADLTGVRSGTVSLWLQPQWAEGSQDDAALVSLGDQLQLVKNVNFLRFEALGEGGKVASGVGAPITDWRDGEWHQVTVTWESGQLALYLDGQLVSRQHNSQPVEFGDKAQMLIGSSYPPSRPVAPGVIGQVGLENRSLSPSEVQARFLKTLGQ
jgi:hypothetical protein